MTLLQAYCYIFYYYLFSLIVHKKHIRNRILHVYTLFILYCRHLDIDVKVCISICIWRPRDMMESNSTFKLLHKCWPHDQRRMRVLSILDRCQLIPHCQMSYTTSWTLRDKQSRMDRAIILC